MEEQDFNIAPLDRVEVTGSRITEQGRIIVFAAELKKGDKMLELRDAQGAPLWGKQKRVPGE